VVLVDLALEAPNVAAVASEAGRPGIIELVNEATTFGEAITRDRYSRAHLITAGRAVGNTSAIIGSQRLVLTLEALARSYDHVVIDAGALPNLSAERFAELAPRAVLIVNGLDDPATPLARERLLAAGFSSISFLVSAPPRPQSVASGTQAAA
jgi:Mrp family chromosome partitioning ATPase